MKRTGGNRRKTRHKLAKNVRDKGKINIANYLQHFKLGDKVCLVGEPAVQKGMYYPRFYGKMGNVVGKKGQCYEVMINDVSKEKIVIVHPVHLKRL